MKTARIALLTGALLAWAPAAWAQVPVTADTLARAKAAFAQIAGGKIDRGTLTPELSSEYTDDVLATMTQRTTALGEPDKFVPIGQTDSDGITTTVFRLHCPQGLLDYTFGIDDATNKIAKLYFTPGPSQ